MDVTKNCPLIFIKKWFFSFMCKDDHLGKKLQVRENNAKK